MNKNTVLMILGGIVAVTIAWFLVNLLFSLLWFIGKLLVVAVVAVIVLFALRALLVKSDERS